MDGLQIIELMGFRLPRSRIRISTEFNVHLSTGILYHHMIVLIQRRDDFISSFIQQHAVIAVAMFPGVVYLFLLSFLGQRSVNVCEMTQCLLFLLSFKVD